MAIIKQFEKAIQRKRYLYHLTLLSNVYINWGDFWRLGNLYQKGRFRGRDGSLFVSIWWRKVEVLVKPPKTAILKTKK